jgi:hypothetical protein
VVPAPADLAVGPAVTGVGSLPHTEPAAAVAAVLALAPRAPWWPQLPRRGTAEGMLRQALGVPPDLLVDAPGGLAVPPGGRGALLDALAGGAAALTEDQAAAFERFRSAVGRRVAGGGGRPGVVKGQQAGPATVLAVLQAADGSRAAEDDELAAAVTARLADRARWQAGALADLGVPALLVLDEPVLGPAAPWPGAAAAVDEVLAAVRAGGAAAGLHSCATGAAVPPGLHPDAISLDLLGGPAPAALAAWHGGGLLLAGVLATGRSADGADHGAAVARWRVAAADHPDVPALAARTLVTSTCGLAGAPVAGAEAALRAAAAVAARLVPG